MASFALSTTENDNMESIQERKLTPQEFYQKIGSPRYIVAPMVDQSDLSFRMMTRKYGANLTYTQMFNCNSFLQCAQFRAKNFQTCEGDRPLIVQFCGHEPTSMLKAAKFVENSCDAVDINIGCPQNIARRGRYGAFLMEELDLLHDMVSTMVKGLKIPVTCKTRIYHNFDRSVRLCQTLIDAGASLLTIHGRTREEKGHEVKAPSWEMLRRLKEHFAHTGVPIIANGGIETMDDVMGCMETTGCDGIMTSEGILENPGVFSDAVEGNGGEQVWEASVPGAKAVNRQSLYRQVELAEEYLSFCVEYPTAYAAPRCTRSHLMRMLHCYLVHHVDIRDALCRAHSNEEFHVVCNMCRKEVGSYEAFTESRKSSSGCVGGEEYVPYAYYGDSWYRRHRLTSPCPIPPWAWQPPSTAPLDEDKPKPDFFQHTSKTEAPGDEDNWNQADVFSSIFGDDDC